MSTPSIPTSGGDPAFQTATVDQNNLNLQNWLVSNHNVQVETSFHTQFAFYKTQGYSDQDAQTEAMKHVAHLWALVDLTTSPAPKVVAFATSTHAINTDAGPYVVPPLQPPDMPSSPIGPANPMNPGIYNVVASMVQGMPAGMTWQDSTGSYVLHMSALTPMGQSMWWQKIS